LCETVCLQLCGNGKNARTLAGCASCTALDNRALHLMRSITATSAVLTRLTTQLAHAGSNHPRRPAALRPYGAYGRRTRHKQLAQHLCNTCRLKSRTLRSGLQSLLLQNRVCWQNRKPAAASYAPCPGPRCVLHRNWATVTHAHHIASSPAVVRRCALPSFLFPHVTGTDPNKIT
jgi:hypothetical protein